MRGDNPSIWIRSNNKKLVPKLIETVFDINVVSIDSNTVITNGYDPDVERKLKKHGVDMIPFDFRHKYFWDSGLHCVTLDLSREGERQSYV